MQQKNPASGAGQTTAPPPTLLQLVIFGFPALPHAFIALPVNIIIPAFYAANTTVTLAQIALVTTASRIIDAFIDPAIGLISDRTKSPIGRRKPYVLLGTLLCAVAIYHLFQPPKTADITYYATWYFSLYVGFTLFEIPRSAWATELSRDYQQRARISGWVSIFNVAGSLVFWLTPLVLSVVTGTTQINATALMVIAWLYVILMPSGMLLATAYVGNGETGNEKLTTIRDMFRSLTGNRPLWVYFAAIGAWGVGQGALLSVIFVFLTDYMQLGSAFPILMIAFFVVTLAALPIWLRVIAWIGKHRAWALGLACDALLRPLILLFPPGADSLAPMLGLVVLSAFFGAPANIAPMAILGDVVDYDLLKRKVNNAGNFFALNTLFIKIAMAVGGGVALMALDLTHYQVGKPNDLAANTGLLVCYFVLPAVFHLLSASIGWRFPIDARRHAIILKRIRQRQVREAAAPA